MRRQIPEFLSELPKDFWAPVTAKIRYEGELEHSARRGADYRAGNVHHLKESIQEAADQGTLAQTDIQLSLQGNAVELFSQVFPAGSAQRPASLGSLRISQSTDRARHISGTFANLSVGTLRLHAAQSIAFENCTIGRLSLTNVARVRLSNCTIGEFLFPSSDPGRDLHIEDSTIVAFRVNLESCRDIALRNTRFARQYVKGSPDDYPESLRYLDRESFAELHKWAEQHGNTKLAHLSRAHVLTVEHAEAEQSEKVFFALWRLFSDYGLSYWRPLAWLSAASVVFFCALLCGGTFLAQDLSPSESSSSWKTALLGEALSAQIGRAVIGTLESISSPFSLFSGRRLVEATTGWVAAAQFGFGFFSLAMLFLFGFAVRRRFKV